MSLIVAVPVFLLISVKNISMLIEMSKYGVISLGTYFLFVMYQFISAAAKDEIKMENVNWFSFDIGHLLGNSAVAFAVHVAVITFLRKNEKQ